MNENGQPTEHRILTTRRARYFVLGPADREPAVVSAGARGVWIVCHGFGQAAAKFVTGFGVVANAGCTVVAPEALNRFYHHTGPGSHATAPVGATWMTREDRLAEIDDYVEYLDAVRRDAVPNGSPVTVLGFSQGVATAARWVTLGSAAVNRLILWAGAIPPELDLAAMAARVTRPIVLVAGDRDEFAPWARADDQLARLDAVGVRVEVRRFSGGHRLDDGVLAALAP